MSLQRFSACCRYLSTRKQSFSHRQIFFQRFKEFKQPQQEIRSKTSIPNALLGSSLPAPCYSTIAKHNISKSLKKWKRQKRKSKAQQKRELENLQKDFTQLLTKRAVQLLQEDSCYNSNRRVVTTHTFTNDSVLPLDNVIMEALTTEVGITNSLKFDDILSERLDTHVQSLLHKETTSDSKHTINVLPISHLTKDNKPLNEEKRSSENIHSNIDKPLVSQLIQNYLNNDVSATALSPEWKPSFLLSNSSVFPFFQKEKLFDLSSHKSLKSSTTKHDSHTRLEADAKNTSKSSDISPAFHKGDEFLQLLSKFQEGLIKSCDSNRTWESLEENDHGNITSTFKSEEKNANTFFSTDVGQREYNLPEYKSSLHHSVDQKLFSDEATKQLSKGSVIGTFPKCDSILSDKTESLVLTKKTEYIPVPAKHKKRQERSEHKDFQELIDKSFIDACCFTGNELLAVRNIEFQYNRHGISSLDSFNKLIHTLAKKQNLDAIKSLFSLLRQWNVSPSLQTYAGCLECVGRMAEPDSFLCERLLADMEKTGHDLAEIANSCSFESDEWDYVLKAIQLVNPDFVPNEAPAAPGYTIEMLLPLECENPKRLENNQYALAMDKSEMMERFQEQLEMEKKGVVKVQSIAANSERINENTKLKELQKDVTAKWREDLRVSFTEKMKTFEKKAKNNMSMTVYPYLKLFTPEVYVDIIFKNMQDLFSSSEAYSPTQVMFQLSLGHAVNRMYNIESMVSAGLADKVTKLYDQFADGYLDTESVLDNHRKLWTGAMAKHYDTVNMDTSMKKWPRHVIKMVGKFLLDLILYDLKIDANLFRSRNQQRLVPAFCTIYRPDVTTFTMAEIKVHPMVSKLFKMDSMDTLVFDPSIVPMLVPPIPWISKSMGGLLLGSYSLIRMGDDLYHLDSLKNVKDAKFMAVLDSLNILSACAWKINKPILDLQIQIFKSNGDANLKVSPPASALPPLPTIKPDMTSQEKALLYRERVQLQQQKRDMHGLWCSDLYRLSIANKFRDEIFWFPHSMDFRGRTYPLPPHFNHLGSDNVRGMLLFAKGKPLGQQGHDWLKIHLINLTGFKKRSSNDERLAYAESMMDEILDSADNPLTGRKWWQTSDEPWQTLACCTELAKIERFDGNKEDYICHFPVHQDGSCNGLQHYAALGRDQDGAESVNLAPFDTPQDVYSDVVELVERERKKDAENGDELAIALEGFIKRKVIKQTIMTTVYGVTRFGAKAQIHKQLKDIPDFPQDQAWKASFYLTDKTFNSLREMFRATKDIQDWLTVAAQLISAFKPVDWVTPLGFPVVQPYFKRCSNGSRNRYTTKPNTVKQKNAFPPNYIHSLDSTHMMLTSLFSMHEGITFVSVHDCFWTHACDIPIMNRVCREQFVNMHNQPLLEDLSQHLLKLVDRSFMDPSLNEELKNLDTISLKNLLANVPKRGTFNLDDVLNSPYFFS